MTSNGHVPGRHDKRGREAGACGWFEPYESLSQLTCADFLADPLRRTSVCVRFATVTGSDDTVGDMRTFAVRFYTREGTFDLVAHDLPVMSDRALSRSYRHMQGFGVDTLRLVDAAGNATSVKFHWRPCLGTHSPGGDETRALAGQDPDFASRDLWEAIENRRYPEYELCMVLVDRADEHRFDLDLPHPTEIVPQETPLRPIGRMLLDRNPENYFAETERIAFHAANVVPGIDFAPPLAVLAASAVEGEALAGTLAGERL